MDGSGRGFAAGGRGRNRTSVCRHPAIKKKRKKKRTSRSSSGSYYGGLRAEFV